MCVVQSDDEGSFIASMQNAVLPSHQHHLRPFEAEEWKPLVGRQPPFPFKLWEKKEILVCMERRDSLLERWRLGGEINLPQ